MTSKKCYNKNCKDKAFIYDNYVGEKISSCFYHKPIGWKRSNMKIYPILKEAKKE